MWGKLREERHCTITRWSLAAYHCLFRMGPQYNRQACSVNRMKCLRMFCVDIQALWCPGVCAIVLVDGLQWSHKCLRRIYQFFDGMVHGGTPLRGWFRVVPISCRQCLNHRIVLCDTLIRLAPSAVLKLVCSVTIFLFLSTMLKP